MRIQRYWPAVLVSFLVTLTACGGPADLTTNSDGESGEDALEIAAAPGAAPNRGPTLVKVQEDGRLNCGVAENVPGFSSRDLLGQWRGFDVDLCRAVAAAVLGNAGSVRIVPLDARARFSALQAGQVDVIARGGWNFTRDAGLGVDFVGVSFYDSQGFLVDRSFEGQELDTLAGRQVCVQAGTSNELNLVEHFQDLDEALRPAASVYDTAREALEAYRAGDCDALSGDISTLAAERSLLRDADAHVILPIAISKEPQGPIVRQGDDQWEDIVAWTLNTQILAAEFGVTSRSVNRERAEPSRPEIDRLINGDGYGGMLMLPEDWAYQIIRQVGSYREVFDRNVGPETDVGLARGLNALWNDEEPGLIFSPPMR